MKNNTIKGNKWYFLSAPGGVFAELLFSYLSIYGVLKMFLIKSYWVWFASIVVIYVIVSWIQCIRAGTILKYNFLIGGLVAIIPLHIVAFVFFPRLFSYTETPVSLLSVVIIISYIIAAIGYKVGSEYNDSKDINHILLFLVTGNIFLLVPVLIMIYLLVIMFLKFLTGI